MSCLPVSGVPEVGVIGAHAALIGRAPGDALDGFEQRPKHVGVVVGPLVL